VKPKAYEKQIPRRPARGAKNALGGTPRNDSKAWRSVSKSGLV